MSKKHKGNDKAPQDAPSTPPKLSKKERFRALEARVEGLEQRVADLGRVVDEAIRATISVREKASEVRPRRRPPGATPAP